MGNGRAVGAEGDVTERVVAELEGLGVHGGGNRHSDACIPWFLGQQHRRATGSVGEVTPKANLTSGDASLQEQYALAMDEWAASEDACLWDRVSGDLSWLTSSSPAMLQVADLR